MNGSPRCRIAELPPGLLEILLLIYTLGDWELDPRFNEKPGFSRAAFPIAVVCREWHALLNFVQSGPTLRRLEMDVALSTRKDVVELRRLLTLRRAHLTTLELPRVVETGRSRKAVWNSALSLVPTLQEICFGGDMTASWTSSHLGDVLIAAGRHCPQINKLIFPYYINPPSARRNRQNTNHDNDDDDDNNYMVALTRTLFTSAGQWLRASPQHSGGLQHLFLGMAEAIHDWRSAKQYMDAITTTCPNMQHVYGYEMSTHDRPWSQCEELWTVDLATWRRFCAACTKLTDIDWMCLPFATQFFEVFGQTLRPDLNTILISAPANWDWPTYLDQAGHANREALTSSGYADTAVNPQAALACCPALGHLRVEWYYCVPQTNHSPEIKPMNPEIFGDAFCEQLCKSCPRLMTLQYWYASHASPSPKNLSTFTDRSLRALATLSRLHQLELVQVNITGAGLFDLMVNNTVIPPFSPKYDISVSNDAHGVAPMAFYRIVIELLTRAIAYDGTFPRDGSSDVSLRLKGDEQQLTGNWSKACYRKIQKLAAQTKARHPKLQLKGLLSGWNGSSFQCLVQFQIATRASCIRPWGYGITSTPIDDVFEDGTFT